MRLTSIIAIYALFFAASTFILLPFGVKTDEEAGTPKVPGQADSAPHRFDLPRHLLKAGLLGAILTFAGRPFYPIYLGPAQASGIDPVADQQLAGLVMWIPAGVILTLLGLGFFAAWIGAAARRQRGIGPAPIRTGPR